MCGRTPNTRWHGGDNSTCPSGHAVSSTRHNGTGRLTTPRPMKDTQVPEGRPRPWRVVGDTAAATESQLQGHGDDGGAGGEIPGGDIGDVSEK
mmetsp:Transcript_12155/g.21781  ORF Transcript_12155/g.21781 Transcript_12155/m.21781 type:complete len:93 (-) Transcript_12155:1129-1407(-)